MNLPLIMASAVETKTPTWTMNDGGAVAVKCERGGAGAALAEQLTRLYGDTGAVVPISSPSERSRRVVQGIVGPMMEALGAGWTVPASMPFAKHHVPEEAVQQALDVMGKILSEDTGRCVVLLSIGGSSTVELAKAIKHLGPAHPGGIHLGCCTTTFAGSECTNIIGYMEGGRKKVIRANDVRPEVRVYDAALFESLPFDLGMCSGWNAFAHAVGALSGDSTSPIDLLKAEEACRTLIRGFHICARVGKTETGGIPLQALGDLIYGAVLCGSVLNECSMGVHHKLAHVVAGSLGLEHARVHTALLPFSIHFNRDHKPSMIQALSRCGLPEGEDTAGALWDLQKQLGSPISLRKCDFKLDKLDDVVNSAVAGSKSYKNPRPIDAAGITELVRSCHHGRRPSAGNKHDSAILAGASGPHAALPVAVQGVPLNRAKFAIVCVQGRYASAERIVQMMEEALGRQHEAAILAPQAMNSSWYQGSFLLPREQNEPGFSGTMSVIDACVKYAAAVVGAANVVLFGFSQGACSAVSYAATEGSPRLGGVIANSGGLCGADDEIAALYTSKNLQGVPVVMGCAEEDAHVPATRVNATVEILRALGASVDVRLYPGTRHRIYEETSSQARSLLQGVLTGGKASASGGGKAGDPYEYLSGFKAYHQSEALPGTVPQKQRSPRFPAHGLIAECINGSPFCAPRAANLFSWFYRIHPSIGSHGAFEEIGHPTLKGDFCTLGGGLTPEPVRWNAPPEPATNKQAAGLDFVDSLVTLAGSGNPMSVKGVAIHTYGCTKGMGDRAFYDADGDLLVVPELGALDIQTEFGKLLVRPGEVFILPRGLKMTVNLPDGQARGFVCELFEVGHFQLPNLGPLGSNGLADARHFKVPTAAYEDRACKDYELIAKFGGKVHRAYLQYSPYDVVGWMGRYHPCKYDLLNFMAFGSVTWDHADPSLQTVLTCPIDPATSASALDFVCFRSRYDAVTGTFRPPFWHRNAATEFNAIIKIQSDYSGFHQGCHWLTPCMSAHGISAQSYNGFAYSPVDDDPRVVSDGSIWIMFESIYPLILQEQAYHAPHRDYNYRQFFAGVPRTFSPNITIDEVIAKQKAEREAKSD